MTTIIATCDDPGGWEARDPGLGPDDAARAEACGLPHARPVGHAG